MIWIQRLVGGAIIAIGIYLLSDVVGIIGTIGALLLVIGAALVTGSRVFSKRIH